METCISVESETLIDSIAEFLHGKAVNTNGPNTSNSASSVLSGDNKTNNEAVNDIITPSEVTWSKDTDVDITHSNNNEGEILMSVVYDNITILPTDTDVSSNADMAEDLEIYSISPTSSVLIIEDESRELVDASINATDSCVGELMPSYSCLSKAPQSAPLQDMDTPESSRNNVKYKSLKSLLSADKDKTVETSVKASCDNAPTPVMLFLNKNTFTDDANVQDDSPGQTDFSLPSKLANNAQSVPTNSRSYTCCWCDCVCLDSISLLEHLEEQHSMSKVVCPYCKTFCETETALQEHVLEMHNWSCSNLLEQSSETIFKIYSCSRCDEKFVSNESLKRHIKCHVGPKLIACTRCNENFADADELKKHLKFHIGEKPFACSHCGKQYAMPIALELHMRAHLDKTNKKIHCARCNRYFASAINLKQHLLSHKAHTCLEDGNTDIHQSDSVHMEKRLTCEECTKDFKNWKSLQQHQRTHAPVSQHMCSECGKTFTRSTGLKRHIRICSGTCSKLSTSLESDSDNHVTSNADERVTCEECGKDCKNMSSLKQHCRIHKPDNRHKCAGCGKTFLWLTTLKLHLKTHGDTCL